ncbi:MAG: hypothetical protein EOP54_06960, partial [Sphingobacteriales bacterium]
GDDFATLGSHSFFQDVFSFTFSRSGSGSGVVRMTIRFGRHDSWNDSMNFNELKELLDVTDGNLASHLKPLEENKFIKVENQKLQGTVKFFNAEKGFGFIKAQNSSEDVFVHVSGLIDEVKENDVVEYEIQQGRKGINAINVKLVR